MLTARLAQSSFQKLSEAAFYHISPLHPAWTAITRRLHHAPATYLIRSQQGAQIQRWRKNVARLYARRVVEIAMASAALQVFRTDMEKAIERPTAWENFERKDWTDELLKSIGSNKFERFCSAATRLISLATLAAPMTILMPLSYVSEKAHKWSWEYALWGIEQAGPTFVKLVQWATTRQDLFSPEFCQYFGKLRDETAGHAWKETVKILEEELGIGVDYLQLEHTPIGSGCIAQVYKGRLSQAAGQYPAGTDVAIKVQHPGIWRKVCLDFYVMGKFSRLLEALPYLNLEYLSLTDTVRQFRDVMLPQMDLTLEAKNLQRFNQDFKNDDQVSFPFPLHDLTSTRVLTETFITGTPIIEYTTAPLSFRKELANLGLKTVLLQLFAHDLLHGDLHPGNILVSETENGRPKLHLLDCGLVVEMGPEQHVNLVKILGAFTRRNGRLAGQLMVDTSSGSQASPLDVELFVAGIEQIVNDDENNNFVEKVGDYIADICYLACKRRVKLESAFIKAALSVEIMEGIASEIYPDIQVTKQALPLIVQAEMMHRLPKFSLW